MRRRSLAAAADTALPKLQLHAGAHAFTVEVASTPQQRALGLMGRTRLEDATGMLFVFDHKGMHCFWMKNTPLPLSIAFLADDGRIVNIDDMQPQTQDFHCLRRARQLRARSEAGRLPQPEHRTRHASHRRAVRVRAGMNPSASRFPLGAPASDTPVVPLALSQMV